MKTRNQRLCVRRDRISRRLRGRFLRLRRRLRGGVVVVEVGPPDGVLEIFDARREQIDVVLDGGELLMPSATFAIAPSSRWRLNAVFSWIACSVRVKPSRLWLEHEKVHLPLLSDHGLGVPDGRNGVDMREDLGRHSISATFATPRGTVPATFSVPRHGHSQVLLYCIRVGHSCTEQQLLYS
jgi:hypothetical protein